MKHNVLKQSTGMMTVLLLAVLLFTATVPASTQASGQPPLLALASSFRDLWPELSQLYSEQTGQPVPRTSFASSGLLSTQIRHGAPFELFLSADEASVDQLHAAGKTRDDGALLARGTLSLVSLRNQGDDTDEQDLDHTPTLSMLNEGIERQQAFRIAIPNPQHAPYGKAARESLQNNGLWPLPPGFLLNAENAAQTLQFALTGAVEYAIVPDSLLIGAPAELLVTPLPADSYRAVVHKMVLLESAGLQAERLFIWLQQPSASAVLARHGLTPVH